MTALRRVHPLERVLSLLEDVRARCPAHDDRHSSLSITSSPTGTSFRCREGCTGFECWDALRLLASESPSPVDGPRGTTQAAGRVLPPSEEAGVIGCAPGVIGEAIVGEIRAVLAPGPASFRSLRARIGRRWKPARLALQTLVDAGEVSREGQRGRRVLFRLVAPTNALAATPAPSLAGTAPPRQV